MNGPKRVLIFGVIVTVVLGIVGGFIGGLFKAPFYFGFFFGFTLSGLTTLFVLAAEMEKPHK